MASSDDILKYLKEREYAASKEREFLGQSLIRMEQAGLDTTRRVEKMELHMDAHLKDSSDAIQRLAIMEPAIISLKKVVFGNGREGHDTRITRLEQKNDTKQSSMSNIAQWVAIAIMGITVIVQAVL